MYLKIGEEIGVLVLKISNVSALICPFRPNLIINFELLVKTEVADGRGNYYSNQTV